MSTIRLHQTTTSTPEQFVAGLTDFGPGRSKLFGRSASAEQFAEAALGELSQWTDGGFEDDVTFVIVERALTVAPAQPG